jgi:hypothetical protein
MNQILNLLKIGTSGLSGEAWFLYSFFPYEVQGGITDEIW